MVIGVEDTKDEKAKEDFGKLYEALKSLYQGSVFEITRGWDDLGPDVQLMFSTILSNDEATASSVTLLADLYAWISSDDAANYVHQLMKDL